MVISPLNTWQPCIHLPSPSSEMSPSPSCRRLHRINTASSASPNNIAIPPRVRAASPFLPSPPPVPLFGSADRPPMEMGEHL